MAPRTRRLPRVSIGMTMLAVGMAAANFWAIKSVLVGPPAWWAYLAIGSLPTASVLLLVLVAIIGDLRRKREASSFALGFLALGGVGLASMSIVMADFNRANQLFGPWMGFTIDTILSALGFDPKANANQSGLVYALSIVIGELAFLLPQLVFSAIGGFAAKRLGLRLIRTPWPRDEASGPPPLD